MVDKLTAGGVTFADTKDAAAAVVRLASDPKATGIFLTPGIHAVR